MAFEDAVSYALEETPTADPLVAATSQELPL